MNGDDISKITNSTGDFIGSANAWGAMSLSVYITLFLALIITIIIYIFSKNSNNFTKLILEAHKDSNSAVQNNTIVMGRILDILKENRDTLKDTLSKSTHTSEKVEFNGDKIEKILQNTDILMQLVKELKDDNGKF